MSKSVAGSFDADLNKGSGGRPVFLCVARRPAAAPITAIAVVFGASGEFFPPGTQHSFRLILFLPRPMLLCCVALGFQPIKHAASGNPANFNAGTAGHEVCIYFLRCLNMHHYYSIPVSDLCWSISRSWESSRGDRRLVSGSSG